MTKFVITVWGFLISGVAISHPEHIGGEDFGLVHYFSDPYHLVLTGAAVLLLIMAWRSVHGHLSTNLTSQ